MKDCNGYGLWLDCEPLNQEIVSLLKPIFANTCFLGTSPILDTAFNELKRIFMNLLGIEDIDRACCLSDPKSCSAGVTAIVGLRGDIICAHPGLLPHWPEIRSDGYRLLAPQEKGLPFLAVADSEKGILYAVFAIKRLLESEDGIPANLDILDEPKIRYRMLNHWDNLNRSIERGYAGETLWNWDDLPQTVDPRYTDYARACASVGINTSVLNNVNTQPEILSTEYLKKVASIAEVLRNWGITTFLSVNFGSPRFLGSLNTSDPLNQSVIDWWSAKIDEIYTLIPDFGGFLVKADSEGQPGPFAYGRTHADGANMLARPMKKYGGIVIWRAFVYGHGESDRAKKAWINFKPHDGEFEPNAIIQVKNGPIDFQPREPVSPLFGALTKTPVFMELQIAQEYLGQGNHIVYLAPMWKEIFNFETMLEATDSRVGALISTAGSPGGFSGIAAVTNTGNDQNWCGSRFHQANWYAYGRLAWDFELEPEVIAQEWIRATWTREKNIVEAIWQFMSGTWEACIDYMTPLGLHHIMKEHHHYGPDPAFDTGVRKDWRSTYYHRADANGLGFDRSRSGSAMVDQYSPLVAELFNNIETCPEDYLVFFHHVPWDYVVSSGRSLRDELVFRYRRGVETIEQKRNQWLALEGKVDPHAWKEIHDKLNIQCADAKEWEAVCVPYFLSFADAKRK